MSQPQKERHADLTHKEMFAECKEKFCSVTVGVNISLCNYKEYSVVHCKSLSTVMSFLSAFYVVDQHKVAHRSRVEGRAFLFVKKFKIIDNFSYALLCVELS